MMGRPKKSDNLPADDNFDPQRLDEAGQAATELNAAEVIGAETYALGIEVGRLEAMTFITTIGEMASVSIYESIKKSKGWRFVRNPQSSDGRNFESLDEFCRVKLGRSYNRLQELVANRNLLGQEAFEKAERIGLRQVDYNAIKALPAPDQELIRRATEEAQSRDEVLSLLQELAARHANEKEELTSRLTEVEANYEKQGELIGGKDQKINELEMKLRPKQRVSLTDWPAEFQGYINQVVAAKKAIEVNAGALDIIRTDAMNHEAAPGEEAALEKAREALGLELAASIARAEECIGAVRHIFDKTLGALVGA